MDSYRCVHCYRLLDTDAEGNPVPCPDHPDGAIELIPEDVE